MTHIHYLLTQTKPLPEIRHKPEMWCIVTNLLRLFKEIPQLHELIQRNAEANPLRHSDHMYTLQGLFYWTKFNCMEWYDITADLTNHDAGVVRLENSTLVSMACLM